MKKIIIFVYFALTAVLVFADGISNNAKLSVPEITPEAIIVPIEVEYLIPLNMYQSYNSDFFYFTVEGIEGIVQDEITYPEGDLKDGMAVYFGKTVLSSNIRFPADLLPGAYILHIHAGYQLCDITGMCYFPVEKEIIMEIEFNSQL